MVSQDEDVITHCKANNINGAIVYVDQSKAFDRVEWGWLYMVMEKYGFHIKFINWIKMLYKNARSCVLTNGYLSRTFPLSRGVRQGSPLSAYLYILQAEPLAEAVRKSDVIQGIKIDQHEEIKITTYADDTQNYFLNDKSLDEYWKLLETYSKAAGAKINKIKTKIMIVGDEKGWKLEVQVQKVQKIKALGVMQVLEKSDEKSYWKEKLEKCEKHLKTWKQRNLTYRGKVHIIQSLIIGTILYPARFKCVPKQVRLELEKMMWRFLWEGKPERVKRMACIRARVDGGLSMPHLESVINSNRVMILIRILCGKAERWKVLPRKYFKCLDSLYGEENFALKVTSSEQELYTVEIPQYYRECIIAWQMFRAICDQPETKSEIMNQYLWCNVNLKVNGKTLSDPLWAKRGIMKIRDVINENGTWKTDMIKQIVPDKAAIILKMNKIHAAIPILWKEKIRNYNCNEEITYEKLYTVLLKGRKREIQTIKTKEIYECFINAMTVKSKAEHEWELQFGKEMNFSNIFSQLDGLSKIIQDRKVNDFNWKCIQKAIWTEQKLSRIGLSNGSCSKCAVETEDLEHLLFLCECIDGVWDEVQTMLNKVDECKVKIDFETIMFGTEKNEVLKDKQSNVIKNYLIGEAKWLIWKSRNACKYDGQWESAADIIQRLKGQITWKKLMLEKVGKQKLAEILNQVVGS